MKKIFSFLLVALLVVFVSGCVTPDKPIECGENEQKVDNECVPCAEDEVLVDGVCTLEEEDTTKPVFNGLQDVVEIYKGTTFDKLAGITATDDVDGDVTSFITVEGVVNTEQEGEYELTYAVRDNSYNLTTQTITVKVLPAEGTLSRTMWKINAMGTDFDWVDEGTGVDYEVTDEDGTYVLGADISSVGSNPWDVNIGAKDIQTLQGKKYTVSVTLKTDIADGRKVTLFMEDHGNNYMKYFEEIFDITTEWTTITWEHDMTHGDNEDTKLGLFLGNVLGSSSGKVYIKDFTMIEEESTVEIPKLDTLTNLDFMEALVDGEFVGWKTELVGAGDATFTQDPTAGTMTIDIVNPGVNKWDVQLLQSGIEVEGEFTYTITVNMSGTAGTVGTIRLENGPANIEYDFVLTDTATDYVVTVDTTQASSGQKFALFFGSQGDPVVNTGSQVVINSVTITKEGYELPGLENIKNGDFTEAVVDGNIPAWGADFTTWTGTEKGTVAIVDDAGTDSGKAIEFDITDVSTDDWHVQLFQEGYTTYDGKTYTVTFKMKADAAANGRTVGFILEDVDAGYVRLVDEVATLSTEWQTFTYTYRAEFDNADTKFGVLLGNAGDNALVGKVSVADVVITVADSVYTLDEIRNADFTEALVEGAIPRWGTDFSSWTGVDKGTAALVDDAATDSGKAVEIDVTNVGEADWHIQLFQEGYTTMTGKTYTISFKIKADAAADTRTFGFILEDPDNGYNRFVDMVDTLTTEYQTFTYTYVADVDNTDTKFGILLGTAGDNPLIGKVTVADVVITVADTVDGDVTSTMPQ